MKNIVILGGSYAGIAAVHQLLKQSAKTVPIKVTLVTPNTHLYWNVAAPRGLIPNQFTDEQLFQPIAAGFEQYPAEKFQFILASAESINVKAKQIVTFSPLTGKRTLEYDYLILATGSSAREGVPLKGLGSTEATKQALHELQTRVQKAKTIAVAGGGVTGCEVAGELAYEYGKEKDIVMLASGSTLLEDSPESVSKLVINELENLGVKIELQARVIASQLPDDRTELTLPDGRKLVVDVYIPTFGLVPNSSYVPSEFLNVNGFVVVDEYLQVNGAGPIWAIGDVSATEGSQYVPANNQAAHVVKNIILSLNGKKMLPYKAWTISAKGFQIGKKSGSGHFGSWKIPTFLVVYLRKTLFIERLVTTVNGSLF